MEKNNCVKPSWPRDMSSGLNFFIRKMRKIRAGSGFPEDLLLLRKAWSLRVSEGEWPRPWAKAVYAVRASALCPRGAVWPLACREEASLTPVLTRVLGSPHPVSFSQLGPRTWLSK